jgi:hypothetical protein
LEAAHLRITMEERDNASAARPQEHANAQGSSATSGTSAMGIDHPTVGTTSTSPVSAQVASPISSAAGARHTTVGTILPPRTPAPAAISAVSRELAWSVLDPRVQETQVARDHPQARRRPSHNCLVFEEAERKQETETPQHQPWQRVELTHPLHHEQAPARGKDPLGASPLRRHRPMATTAPPPVDPVRACHSVNTHAWYTLVVSRASATTPTSTLCIANVASQ